MLQETEIADQYIECLPKTSNGLDCFACGICKLKTNARFNMRRHIKMEHPDKMRAAPSLNPVNEFFKLGAIGAPEQCATGQVSPGAQSSSSSLASPPSGTLFFPDQPGPSKRRLSYPSPLLDAAEQYIDTETENHKTVSGAFQAVKKYHCKLCTVNKQVRKYTRTTVEEVREHIVQNHLDVLQPKERKSTSPDKKRSKMDHRAILSRRIAHSGRATTLMPTAQPAVAKPARRARSPGSERGQPTAVKPPTEISSKKVEFAKKSANPVAKTHSNSSLPATLKKVPIVVASPPLMSRMNGPLNKKRSVLSDLEEDAPQSPKKKADDASSSASSSSFSPVAPPISLLTQNTSIPKSDSVPSPASVFQLPAPSPSVSVIQLFAPSPSASVIHSAPLSPPPPVAAPVTARVVEPQLDVQVGSPITVVCGLRTSVSPQKELKRGGSSSALVVCAAGSGEAQPVIENSRGSRSECAETIGEPPSRPEPPSPVRPLPAEIPNIQAGSSALPALPPSTVICSANKAVGLGAKSVYEDPPHQTIAAETSEIPSNFQTPCDSDLLQPIGKSGKYVCRECWYGPEQRTVIVEHILSLHHTKKEPLKDVARPTATSSKSPSIDPADWLHEAHSEISEQVAPVKRGRGRPRKNHALNPPKPPPPKTLKRGAPAKSPSSGASGQSSGGGGRGKKKFQGMREVKELQWEYRSSEDEEDWTTEIPGFAFLRDDKVFMQQAASRSGLSIRRLKSAFTMQRYVECRESQEWIDGYMKKGPVEFPDSVPK